MSIGQLRVPCYPGLWIFFRFFHANLSVESRRNQEENEWMPIPNIENGVPVDKRSQYELDRATRACSRMERQDSSTMDANLVFSFTGSADDILAVFLCTKMRFDKH